MLFTLGFEKVDITLQSRLFFTDSEGFRGLMLFSKVLCGLVSACALYCLPQVVLPILIFF